MTRLAGLQASEPLSCDLVAAAVDLLANRHLRVGPRLDDTSLVEGAVASSIRFLAGRGGWRLEREAPFLWRFDTIAASAEHVDEAPDVPFDAAAVHSIRKDVGA
jgi:hypothetical protein